MDKRIFTSVLIILMALAAMGGATLAWFTSEATIGENVFTAGTIVIDADEDFDSSSYTATHNNWNPGDEDKKQITIDVKGSKNIYLRAKIDEEWTGLGQYADTDDNDDRNLRDRTIQVNGEDITVYDYYIERWSWFNNTPNKVSWLVETNIDDEKVYVPWPLGRDSEDFDHNTGDWRFHKYELEGEGVEQKLFSYWYYFGEGVQDGGYLKPIYVQEMDGDDPVFDNGEPVYELDSNGNPKVVDRKIEFLSKVGLKGNETGNDYQGATYTMNVKFDAIQVTHEAVFDQWKVGYINDDRVGGSETGVIGWFDIKEDTSAGYFIETTATIDDDVVNVTFKWESPGAGEPNYMGWQRVE